MLDTERSSRVIELIGPAYGAQSMFYFKPPTARGQALHQDNLYLQAHPETCLAAWIAVDDCDGENGGLIVRARSHLISRSCPGGRRSGGLVHEQHDPRARRRRASYRPR